MYSFCFKRFMSTKKPTKIKPTDHLTRLLQKIHHPKNSNHTNKSNKSSQVMLTQKQRDDLAKKQEDSRTKQTEDTQGINKKIKYS